MTRAPITFALALALAGCVPEPPALLALASAPVPATDSLYTPRRVVPGRLAYAPDRTSFAPILTERFAYPTQVQANDAYRRLLEDALFDGPVAASVWLFGCKPGALDPQTAQVVRLRAPVVHCATDFLDAGGRRLYRQTAMFAYRGAAWRMEPVDPPRALVPGIGRERSPRDPWSWLPGRDRYE